MQWSGICLSMQEMRVRSLGQEDPLEKGKATQSSILAWRIPWTGEPDGLQSTGVTKSRTWLKMHAQWNRVPAFKVTENCFIVQSLSCIQPCPRGFSRQEYWSGLPFLSPGELSDPGIKPGSPALLAASLLSELPGKSQFLGSQTNFHFN